MPSLTKSKSIQQTIRANLAAPASSLIRIPEIESESTADAIRKLQVQVFELSDALHELTEYVVWLQERAGVNPSRIFP